MSQREEQYGGRPADARHSDSQDEQPEKRSGEDEKGNPGNPDMGDPRKVEPAPGKPDSVIHKRKPRQI